MRLVPLAFVLFAFVFGGAVSARADIGPAPVCPSGQHSEYLQGRRCVANGSHLEMDRDSGLVTTAVDKPAAPSTVATTPPTPPGPVTPSGSAAPSTPSKSCTIAFAGERDDAIPAFVALAALVAFAFTRRRPTA